ncbi:hypothetical protein M5K25_004039 [Dendrobium thyrsiflorum]|uniref:Uncharacterized protein n=1 Tax=Dendrobium thyrsiflorum TaxID=117978 RepID=A0ABD0VKN0_DENTH
MEIVYVDLIRDSRSASLFSDFFSIISFLHSLIDFSDISLLLFVVAKKSGGIMNSCSIQCRKRTAGLQLTREARLAILRSSCSSWVLEVAEQSDMALSSCTGSWVLSSSNSLLDAINSDIASCSSLIESKGSVCSFHFLKGAAVLSCLGVQFTFHLSKFSKSFLICRYNGPTGGSMRSRAVSCKCDFQR